MTDTNELRKLLEKATPTPWGVSHGDESWMVVQTKPDGTPYLWARRIAFDDGSAAGEYSPNCDAPTRDLIVDAVNGLPAMLDELDALRAEVERLRADVDFQKRMTDAWADIISNQVKEATALRRDLAEAIYLLRLCGFCTEADPDHELLLVERRQKLLDRHP